MDSERPPRTAFPVVGAVCAQKGLAGTKKRKMNDPDRWAGSASTGLREQTRRRARKLARAGEKDALAV
jgi:hypothetical protein